MNKFYFCVGILFFISCSNDNGNKIRIEVCKHFNNADATIIQCSDQYYNQSATYNISRQFSAEVAEFEALKNNIPIHVFENKIERGLKEYVEMGRGGVSVYYPSCSTNYRKSKLDSILADLQKIYGRKPTTLAYGCGKTDYAKNLPNYILGGRNSSAGSPLETSRGINSCTFYGQNCGDSSIYPVNNLSFIKNRLSASRSWTNVILNDLTENESLNFVKIEVKKTILNGGFYLDFMHWHIDDYNSKNAQKFIPKLFKTIKEVIGNNYIAKVDYNQAVEYQHSKSLIDSVSLIEKKDYYFIITYTNQNLNIDYNVLKTPISFKTNIDLEEEELKKLASNDAIHSITKNNKKVIVNLFINFNNNINTFTRNKKQETRNKIHFA